MTPTAYVELFHLMFLRQFASHIDANLYAIKGGCNLRFFFQSIRYSEDLDLDIQIIHQQTLENKINKILTSPALIKLLQGYGVEAISFSSAKQTKTTQRWKIQLRVDGIILPLHTKIEFSRRSEKFKSHLEPVNRHICQLYRLSPMKLSHYDITEAVTQKIFALANRSLTQARDIFDLYHLLHVETPPKLSLSAAVINKAQIALASISFSEYYSQVINFLEPDSQAQFNDAHSWQEMTEEVKNYLNGSTK